MKHLLFTRYNVGLYKKVRVPANMTSEQWMSHRREIFMKYCYPSVMGNKGKFTWYLFFDKGTPAQDMIFDKTVSVEVDENENFDQAVDRIAKEHIEKDDVLITTRLDNDDAIHETFIERVQELVKKIGPKGVIGINFPFGYCYKHGAGDVTRIGPDYGTTFISIASYGTGFTVHNLDNTRIPRKIPTVQDDGKEMWVRIIHDKNLSNYMEGQKVDHKLEGFF